MRRTCMYGGCAMRMRILSILVGAFFTAVPFTVSHAAPSETSKTICLSGNFSALCDRGNNNNTRNTTASSEGPGGENPGGEGPGGHEGCGGYGGEGGYGSYGSKKGHASQSFGAKGFGKS